MTAERILTAAEAQLAAADPGSLRVDRVAQAAAVNKRMIYHYFGDRDGLLQAVYARQLAYLLHPDAALSRGTRRVLRTMLRPLFVSVDVAARPDAEAAPHGGPDAHRLQTAARLLMPQLLQVPPRSGARVSAPEWMSFCVEMMSLALAAEAPMDFPQPPGSTGFVEISERLLTPRQRLRMKPDSRAYG